MTKRLTKHGTVTESRNNGKFRKVHFVFQYWTSHPKGPKPRTWSTKHENVGTVASSELYSAFPYTFCRGVFTSKIYTALHWGHKNKRIEQIYPKFQNAVGILILKAVLSLNFQASQNREKNLYIQAHKDPTTI